MVKVMNRLRFIDFFGPKIVHFQNILFRGRPEQEKELELISSWRFCGGEEKPTLICRHN